MGRFVATVRTFVCRRSSCRRVFQSTGRRATYCSARCRVAAWREAHR